MDNQLDYYKETGELRDEFDRGLSVMAAYTTFRKAVYQDGALSLKDKGLSPWPAASSRAVPATFRDRRRTPLPLEPQKTKCWRQYLWLSSWAVLPSAPRYGGWSRSCKNLASGRLWSSQV